MKLIELKPDTFYYCNKQYEQRRYISTDLKLFITIDSLNYVICYNGTPEGKGKFIDEIYHNHNRHSYPCYSIESAIQLIQQKGIELIYPINVNPTHYKNTKKEIEF